MYTGKYILRYFFSALLILGVLFFEFIGRADAQQVNPIDSLTPGTWYEVPNSHMKAVDPCPASNCSYSGWTGQSSVIGAWSGGAFDTTRDRLLVWGGGHADYAGNELYAFDLNTLSWTRLTEPSTDVGGVESSGEYPDGKPRSRHTYDYIEYSPVTDRFYTFGGGGMYPSGQVGTLTVYAFDFKTNAWLHLNNSPNGGWYSGIDTQTGHIWVDGGGIRAVQC